MITTPIATNQAHQVPQGPRVVREPEENQDPGGDQASLAHQGCRDPQGNEVGISGCCIKDGICKCRSWGRLKSMWKTELGKLTSLDCIAPEERCVHEPVFFRQPQAIEIHS